MQVIRGVCTNLFFPASRWDAGAFGEMASFLRDYGIGRVECYCDGHQRSGPILRDLGMEGVYVAVIALKEAKKNLCDVDECAREAAVRLAQRCMDQAAEQGFGTLMINSGQRVCGREREGMDALALSLKQLFRYRQARGLELQIEMEPCDSGMEAMHLIGSCRRALSLCERLHREGCPLRLAMDSAHSSEEGEDFIKALAAVKPYCNHIHLANCRIDHPADPLYGDKHLGYEYDRSVWNYAAIAQLMEPLASLYRGESLCIALECLCREEDPFSWFASMWDNLPAAFRGQERP